MIELNPSLYSQIFPGCNSNLFAGTKEELLQPNTGIVIYGEEHGQWRFITEWDLSAWTSNLNSKKLFEIEELKTRVINLEMELLDIKSNSIKIDEADFAYLLLRYKE